MESQNQPAKRKNDDSQQVPASEYSLEELLANSSCEDFLKQDIIKYINEQDEILIIGTGNSHKIIDINIKNNIKSQFQNISISEMSSDSACRTYNILAFEQRNVKAIILPFNNDK